jgi:hypothetical protein
LLGSRKRPAVITLFGSILLENDGTAQRLGILDQACEPFLET